MKKILYSTTALAAAGLLALMPADAMAQKKAKKKVSGDKIKLKVGGYMETRLSWSDQEGSYETALSLSWDSFNIVNDSEIYFTGSTQLDNGIKISTVVQLEADWAQSKGAAGATTAMVDESYIKFTGGFGDLRIGHHPHASFYMDIHAPSTGIMINANPDALDLLVAPAAVSGPGGGSRDVTIGKGDDELKISYRSPRFAGFQIGGSYKPDTAMGDTVPAPGGTAGASVARTVAGAVNYTQKFGGVGIRLGVDFANWAGSATANDAGDNHLFHTGAEISYAGFTVGGDFGSISANTGGGVLTSHDVEGWSIGARYATGPWTVATNYYHNEHEGLIGDPGEDETTQFGVQARYKLGPGVYVGANLNWIEWEDEAATTTDANNNEGWLFVTGLRVSF